MTWYCFEFCWHLCFVSLRILKFSFMQLSCLPVFTFFSRFVLYLYFTVYWWNHFLWEKKWQQTSHFSYFSLTKQRTFSESLQAAWDTCILTDKSQGNITLKTSEYCLLCFSSPVQDNVFLHLSLWKGIFYFFRPLCF